MTPQSDVGWNIKRVELEEILSHERKYCEAVDAKLPNQIARLFDLNGALHYKDHIVRGRSEIAAFYEDFFQAAPRWWRHWTMNPQVTRSGDEIRVELDLLALMETEEGLELANSIYSDILIASDRGLEFKVKEIIPQKRLRLGGQAI